MAEFDKTDYDVAVLGTGVCECMLAASLARAGKSVVVLEGNGYYGGAASTFSLKSFISFLQSSTPYDSTADAVPEEGKIALREAPSPAGHGVYDGEITYLLEEVKEPGTPEGVDNGSPIAVSRVRQFTADLQPTLFYSRSPMLRLIASSGISRYLEFRAVNNCMIMSSRDSAPRVVPNSKAALFADKTLTLPQKRMLMKFLQEHVFLAAPQNQETSQIVPTEKTQADEEKKTLPDNCSLTEYIEKNAAVKDPVVRQLLTYGIALADSGETTNVKDGMESMALYAKSIGVYGPNTPFLSMMYGTSELSQGFAREAAIYGSTFILNSEIIEIKQQSDDKEHPWRIDSSSLKDIKVAHVVVPACRFIAPKQDSDVCWQRCTVITKGPIVNETELSCTVIAPGGPYGNTDAAVKMIQFDPGCKITSKGYYESAFIMRGNLSVRPQLRSVVEHFVSIPSSTKSAEVEGNKPAAYFCAYHTQVCRGLNTKSNVLIAPDVNAAIDFGDMTTVVEGLFRSIVGEGKSEELEFLPPMPDPEDVSWEMQAEAEAKKAAAAAAAAAQNESSQ